MSAPPAKLPEILDKIVDLVLAHKPKPKSAAAKKRHKSAKQTQSFAISTAAKQPPTKNH